MGGVGRKPGPYPAATRASEYPGEIHEGVRLSASLPTNTFASGEPITITVLVQNTTTNSVRVPFARSASIDLVVLNEKQQALTATNRSIWHTYGGPTAITLPPKATRKYEYRLDQIFDLASPWKYHSYAKPTPFKGGWDKLSMLRTGSAPISIRPQ